VLIIVSNDLLKFLYVIGISIFLLLQVIKKMEELTIYFEFNAGRSDAFEQKSCPIYIGRKGDCVYHFHRFAVLNSQAINGLVELGKRKIFIFSGYFELIPNIIELLRRLYFYILVR